MALLRWTPFDLASENLDEVVRRTFGDFGSSLLANRTQWAPALDAYVEGEELHVRMEIPGIDPDSDVDIEVENGVLHVSGERKQVRTQGDANGDQGGETGQVGGQFGGQGGGQFGGWFRREIHYGRFERRIGLPEGIDPEGVRATYDAGILDITIPLPAKPRTKVKVDVGTQKQLQS